jgi:hypothetical protein
LVHTLILCFKIVPLILTGWILALDCDYGTSFGCIYILFSAPL